MSGISPVIAAAGPRRRRRPSGEPPPLPHRIERRTVASLALVGATSIVAVVLTTGPGLRSVTAVDVAVLHAVARLRFEAATGVIEAAASLGSQPVARTVGWVTLVILLLARRWRHLVVYVLVTLTATLVIVS